jgi:hypothetical protein
MVDNQGTKLVLLLAVVVVVVVVAVVGEEELVPVPVEDTGSALLVDKDHLGKMAAESVSAVAVADAEEEVLAALASRMDLRAQAQDG